MEVSATSNNEGIQWSEDAKKFLVRLVASDAAQRADKVEIFDGLYGLMRRNGLVTIALVEDNFATKGNKNFIKELIVNSMPTIKRSEIQVTQSIYETLKEGQNYTTTDGQIIPCEPLDVGYWHDKRQTHHRLLNRRFNTLVKEFVEYIKFKNEDKPQNLVYAPQRRITASRGNPSRVAKVKVLQGGFKGMTSSNSDGNGGINKRKKGKTGNSDEVNLFMIIFLMILNTIKAYFHLFKDIIDDEPPQKVNNSQVAILIIECPARRN